MPVAPHIADPGSHIARSLRIIEAHPNTVEISPVQEDPKTGAREVDVALRLGLPNAWIADGQSPNGIRAIETVTMRFPAGFPLRAPLVYLRPDFDRSLAHVQPGGTSTRPRPCLFDGNLTELLQQQGIAAILNQLVLWLERAALGELIDPAQGWEPVRRDSLADFVVADAAALRALATRKGGHAAFVFKYAALIDPKGDDSLLHGVVLPERVVLNSSNTGERFKRIPAEAGDQLRMGRSVAVTVWPGRHPSGKLIVTDAYQPETVTDIASLRARAAVYGCDAALDTAVRWLETCVADWKFVGTRAVVVILMARRPWPLIGTASTIELCPYVVEIGAPKLFPQGESTPVRPAGHRQAITPELLGRLSADNNADRLDWIQLGCGSLGSKIALHLARAGRAPSIVIDQSYLSPHNAARHALIPRSREMQVSWLGSKAGALNEAISGLGQSAEPVVDDITAITRNKEKARKALPRKAWAIVNATASLSAREALGSISDDIEIPRVIETVMFSAGKLGVVTVEGPGRNPDSLDLIAETFTLACEQQALRTLMFDGEGLARQPIGEGCGSATMALSDGRVSLLAAPMAEIVVGLQRSTLPECGGRIHTAIVGDDGISVTWSNQEVAPSTVMPIQGPPAGWRVRLAARAAHKIEAEVANWPRVETGGILMGRISEAAQTFYVTDVLPAPEDSERSAGGFCLGTRGARKLISDYAESCGYSLFCLGTWHSHLAPSGPSATDRGTAATVALARLAPSVLLIHTPAGYAALLAHAPQSTSPNAEI